jgi:hypothetical protein
MPAFDVGWLGLAQHMGSDSINRYYSAPCLFGLPFHKYMGSDSINRYYPAPCLFGLPFGNGTALRSVKRSIFD